MTVLQELKRGRVVSPSLDEIVIRKVARITERSSRPILQPALHRYPMEYTIDSPICSRNMTAIICPQCLEPNLNFGSSSNMHDERPRSAIGKRHPPTYLSK